MTTTQLDTAPRHGHWDIVLGVEQVKILVIRVSRVESVLWLMTRELELKQERELNLLFSS